MTLSNGSSNGNSGIGDDGLGQRPWWVEQWMEQEGQEGRWVSMLSTWEVSNIIAYELREAMPAQGP